MSVPSVTASLESGRVAPATAIDRLNRRWYVSIPVALDPLSPKAADAFSDGTWLAAWRSISALLPPIAFVFGAVAPIVWPGMTEVFSESIVFLAVMIALAFLSGPSAVMLLLGYASGDIGHDLFSRHIYAPYIPRQIAADVVSYLLMGVALVLIPHAARRLATELSSKIRDDHFQEAAQVSLSAIAAALLVFLWCQATIVLIRPVFTWIGTSPTTEAVKHVQRQWIVLVAVAVGTLMLRAIGELLAHQSAGWVFANSLQEQRWAAPQRRGAVWMKMPVAIRIVIAAAAVTLLLAGTYVTWFDAGLVFLAVIVLKAWAYGLLGGVPRPWIAAVSTIPALVRFAIAPLLGFAAAWAVIAVFWGTGSLRPVMFGAFFTVIFFHLLFPVPRARRKSEEAP